EQAMRVAGEAIARQAGIENGDLAAGTAELQGGGEAGKAAADDDDVIHGDGLRVVDGGGGLGLARNIVQRYALWRCRHRRGCTSPAHLLMVTSSVHDPGEDGLIQPAGRGTGKEEDRFVAQPRHDARTSRAQSTDTRKHYGRWLHDDSLQYRSELLLRRLCKAGIRHAWAKHRDGNAIALELAMKGFAKAQYIGLGSGIHRKILHAVVGQ